MTTGSDDLTNVVLDIANLIVGLGRNPLTARIIDDVSLQVREAETLCLVGESGSGKSVTALTVMGLLQKGALVPCRGSVRLVGEELLTASDRRLRQLRATTMAMIFQEPMTALNPVMPVGRQIDEVLRVHTDLDARARRNDGAGAAARGRAHFRILSAPAVGRPAPAHHDRDGAGAGAEAADRGRADHGARRHHPKANSHVDP
jgi:ABC-type dipeptide/oligopeptide/nickel transport system ATPase component